MCNINISEIINLNELVGNLKEFLCNYRHLTPTRVAQGDPVLQLMTPDPADPADPVDLVDLVDPVDLARVANQALPGNLYFS